MPQVITSTTAVRIAVARSEFTSFNPAFAKIAVNAAKTADNKAYISQYGKFDIAHHRPIAVPLTTDLGSSTPSPAAPF